MGGDPEGGEIAVAVILLQEELLVQGSHYKIAYDTLLRVTRTL